MQDSEPVPLPVFYGRLCVLAHDLNNKLSVIVGQCEVLSSHEGVTAECAQRLEKIKELAIAMSKRINGSDCRMVVSGEENGKSAAALGFGSNQLSR
jgi:hypothetical protein